MTDLNMINIWCIECQGSNPPMFCRAYMKNGRKYLQIKNEKGKYLELSFEDLVYQLNKLCG